MRFKNILGEGYRQENNKYQDIDRSFHLPGRKHLGQKLAHGVVQESQKNIHDKEGDEFHQVNFCNPEPNQRKQVKDEQGGSQAPQNWYEVFSKTIEHQQIPHVK